MLSNNAVIINVAIDNRKNIKKEVGSMKDLIIMGAGGLGRELAQWIQDINAKKPTWNLIGFIDDNPKSLDGYLTDYKVIGSISDWQPTENQVFACAIAQPNVKQKTTQMLKARGAVFATIIHPTASIGEHNLIGEGFVAYPNAVVTTNVTIGDFVTLLSSAVGHDAVVGSYTTICSFCDITGGVHVGSYVWMGTHSAIIPGRTVGNNAMLSAGSVIMTDVAEGDKMLGNPARRMKF